jgi:hypothetical protein
MSSAAIEFLQTNVWRLPFLLIYIVGAVLALTTWRRHPFASGLSLAAFLLLGFSNIAGAVLFWYAFRLDPLIDRGQLFTIGNIGLTAVSCLGWVLILIALFRRRPQPMPRPWLEEPPPMDEDRPGDERPADTGIRPPR